MRISPPTEPSVQLSEMLRGLCLRTHTFVDLPVETGSSWAALACLELTMSTDQASLKVTQLHLPTLVSRCWDQRCVRPHPALTGFLKVLQGVEGDLNRTAKIMSILSRYNAGEGDFLLSLPITAAYLVYYKLDVVSVNGITWYNHLCTNMRSSFLLVLQSGFTNAGFWPLLRALWDCFRDNHAIVMPNALITACLTQSTSPILGSRLADRDAALLRHLKEEPEMKESASQETAPSVHCFTESCHLPL